MRKFIKCTKASIKALKSGIESTNFERISVDRACQWRAAKCKNGKCVEYCIYFFDSNIHEAKIISEAKKNNYGVKHE